MLMQERVEDGEVPRVAPNREAILAALDQGDEFGTVPWVACRATLVDNDVKRVRESRKPSTD